MCVHTLISQNTNVKYNYNGHKTLAQCFLSSSTKFTTLARIAQMHIVHNNMKHTNANTSQHPFSFTSRTHQHGHLDYLDHLNNQDYPDAEVVLNP